MNRGGQRKSVGRQGKKGTSSKRGNVGAGKRQTFSRDKSKYIDFKDKQRKGDPLPSFSDEIRLNKFLSNAGICSRREADVLIKTGVITVNGEMVMEMGYKVKPGDVVKYDGETISTETKRYILLNKPKGFSSSTGTMAGKKSAFDLVKKACKEVVYPVDRLEKDAAGLMLFTNDGDLAKKLMHPKHRALKLYHVELSKRVRPEDIAKLLKGIQLEDGTTRFTQVEYVEDSDNREVGIELFSGKSQVVQRAFEALGYSVAKMDRVAFAGLTKKDLPRGYYRHLTEKEIAFLKMK